MVKAVSLLMATAQAFSPNSWWKGVTNPAPGPAPVVKSGPAAPLWLPWGAWSSCRGVCGSGVSNRLRRCLNGVAGVDCNGDSLDSRACDNPVDDTCSYWSGWGQWQAWACESKPGTRLKRVKTRTCFGRNTDQCVGSTEIVEYENAPLQNYCLVDNQASCCPYNNLQCSTKRCYTQGQCQDPVITSEADVPLPCCDEFDSWSNWSNVAQQCFEQTDTRTRKNLCTNAVEHDRKTVPAIDGEYSEWELIADCDGPELKYGKNQIWQCAGKRVYRRIHFCYDEGVHTTDKYGNALSFTMTEPCGVDADPQWTAWSMNDDECNAVCANAGVVRDRQLYDFCKKTYVPCDVNDSRCRQNCGRVGDWHLWSAWSTCSDSMCGGFETRYRKHECGLWENGALAMEQTMNRDCAGTALGWSQWTQFDAVCANTYPTACTDQYISRSRTSVCGVLSPLTNKLEYSETERILCNKPPMTYITQEGPCSADCHDTINNVFSFKTINTFDACGTLVNQQNEQCNKSPCCYELQWSDWSSCNCAGQATRSRKYFNGCMADDVQTQPCQAPTLPLRNWSAWSTCSGNCPSPQMRFRCPVCAAENSDSTCKNTMTGFDQGAMYESIDCPQVTAYKCDQCVGMCGRGQKKCYQEDQCTLSIIPGTEQLVDCSSEIVMPPDNTPVEGACMHIAGNPLCPGQKNIHKPVHQCYPEASWNVPCGPTQVPADTVGQWSACDPTTCEQTRTISNVCTGLNQVETQPCDMPRSWGPYGECMSDDPNAPRYWYNNEMLPCSGYRKSVLPPVCPGQIAQEQYVACGLELELDSLDNLNSQTCLDNVAHYNDCSRDGQMNCIFPEAKTLSCKNKIFKETVSIVRTPICPKWTAVQCSIIVKLDPKNCDPCEDLVENVYGKWSACSEECKLGYEFVELFQECPNNYLPGPAFLVSYQPPKQQVRQCGPTPQVIVTEGQCLNKNGYCAACSNTGAGTKTVTHTQIVPNKPQCGEQVIKVEEVPCQLPLCPQWQEQPFPACAMCDTSVSRTRQCSKPLGAEMCDCIDTPFDDVKLCPATTNWSEWTSFDLCSRSCGGGEQTRTRYNLCKSEVIETNTVVCNTDPGEFVDTGSRTSCSSNRCVQGINSPILTHTCERDANNNPINIQGQPSLCFEPVQPVTTKTAVGGCMAAVGVPAGPCTQGLQQFIIKNECADLANFDPTFADQTVYETCDVPPVAPTQWTPYTACTKQCINAGEAAEVQTSQRIDECGNVEIRQQLCNVPSCATWKDWIVDAKCSCLNPGAAVVERQCLDGYGQPAVGCIGDSKFQVPCGPNTSAAAVNPTTFALPLLTPAQLAEISALKLDLGSWTQIAGQWSAYSGCAKTCDVTGVCGQEARYIESFCEDTDGNRISIDRQTDIRACPCETGDWQIVADTCSSPDPMTCSGVRTVTKRHTCTGDEVLEQAGSCGTPGTWGQWSAYTQCRTSCQEAVTPTRSRTRSWTCAAERQNGMFADETEIVACPSLVCSYFGAWSSWSACTVSCGMGQKTRTRYCHGGAVGTGLCIGDANKVLGDETVACDMGDCCEWDWSGWTGCCRGNDFKNKRLRLRGNNCGQDVEEIEKACELDFTNPSATYASCSIIRQTGINMVKQGGSLTWMDNIDTAASIMNVINPDNIQNVIYQDFKAEENPLTHELISEAGVIAAPAQVQPQVINQTIMPGQFMPMFQSPFTQNMQMQQQQPVLVQQVVTNQQQMVQPQMVQQQMVQQQMVQPQMVQQEMVQSQMFQQPMVHQQAPAPVAVEETSPNTSPFGSPFDFLFNKN